MLLLCGYFRDKEVYILKSIKKFLNHIFIDGLSGMALGLFATLIVGTILGQIGNYIPGVVGTYVLYVATVAKALMGVGIGVGVAAKFKYSPLVTVSAGVVGFIGSFATSIVNGTLITGSVINIAKVGDPLCAFVAAYIAIEIGNLVSGKTKLDILITPLVTLTVGTVIAVLCGPSIMSVTTWLGSIIQFATAQHPFIMGIIISVFMGIFLTLPISSAAIAVIIGLSGIAGGAAVVGCSAQMVGFAVASYRENKLGGVFAQGIGTSMLQVPNIVRKPIIWLPAILTSAVLGPISTCLLKMTNNATGSGMGTCGLVGQITTFQTMTAEGANMWIVLLEIALMHFILPAILSFFFAETMRKLKWIKDGDMKLDL